MHKWIHKILSQEDILAIEEAIAKAELTTSGEIIPVIVRRSSHGNFFQRAYMSFQDLKHLVHQRALIEFYQSKIQQTKDHTGILIFISLLEREVVVIADKGISDKLSQETWKEVVDLILLGMKEKKAAQGLIKGIQRCGIVLSQHFPIQPHDKNELPNKLIIKD